ncbi:unnamed protein product [Notodromas monacha]|uniref:Uncharacterized protein n=1 Tax=Notodromas monacha TaxID=399045 RepID=A0A7R9BSG7_9CRUS|nr:unnamed protein product [Notodromas monacha]CAG0920885.1 unnamed protein product [Notodromas monacha]
MPKIFLIRNRIEEQQLKLREAQKANPDKSGFEDVDSDASSSPSPYSTAGSKAIGTIYPHLLALLKNDAAFFGCSSVFNSRLR